MSQILMLLQENHGNRPMLVRSPGDAMENGVTDPALRRESQAGNALNKRIPLAGKLNFMVS